MTWEKPMTIPQVAKRYGVPEELVRQGCARAKGYHPIPYVASGAKRPVKYIRPSDFERWFEEEATARA